MGVKGYKGFEKGMRSGERQYAEDSLFKSEDSPYVHDVKGIHFWQNPLDILWYYPLIRNDGGVTEIARVETLGIVRSENELSSTNCLKVEKKISLEEFIQDCIDFKPKINKQGYYSEVCDFQDKSVHYDHYSYIVQGGDLSKSAQTGLYCVSVQNGRSSNSAQSGEIGVSVQRGDYSCSAQSGDQSQSVQSGDGSRTAQSGGNSRSVQKGYRSCSAQSGRRNYTIQNGKESLSAQSGEGSQLIQSGAYSQSAQSGECNLSIQNGDYSRSVQSGDANMISLLGKCCVGVSIGMNSKIRGTKGSWITLAEYSEDGVCKCVKSTQIDGNDIKENTWYTLKDGVFTEYNEE